MKKTIILIIAALFAFVSCEVQSIENPEENAPMVFKLSAVQADAAATKAIKTGWENGDVVFVFISGQTAPNYLELKWNGSEWVNTVKGTVTEIADGTNMLAVYLPFGNDATVEADGGSYKFDKTIYSYYLSGATTASVTAGVVSGTFNMTIPDNYVQFFITDGSASNGNAALREANLIPTAVSSIPADVSAVMETARPAGFAMPGYAYSGGYLFSGKLAVANTSRDYHFGLVNGDSNKQATATNKTMTSHYAANITGLTWTDAAMQLVDLGLSVKWANCNLGATTEDGYGDYYAWGEIEPYYKEGINPEGDLTNASNWRDGKTAGYDWDSYKFWNGSTFTKYNTTDELMSLLPEDDAVQLKIGGGWRMPSREDWKALLDTKSDEVNYIWTWCDGETTKYNGTSPVKGWEIKKKSSGAKVFLPAAGSLIGKDHKSIGSRGLYWSSSRYVLEDPVEGFAGLSFGSESAYWAPGERRYGLSVCPVR